MTSEASELWGRALKALETARTISGTDPDAAASRSYYAAFYAVSAWLAEQGRSYSKHTAVESAIHRDMVKPGILPVELGTHFSWLNALRSTGDYGGKLHVSRDEAALAIARATEIIRAVSELLGAAM